MNLPPENIDRFLPIGETLKILLNESTISKSDVKQLLRKRGVFFSKNELDSLYAMASTCLLSPKEFDFIKERVKVKEDNEKVSTTSIDWDAESTLMAAIPPDFDVRSLVDIDTAKYKVIGVPNFSKVDGNANKVACEYVIERTDLNRNWARVKSQFKGRIQIEKVSNGKKVELQIRHTAVETKQIGDKISKKLVRTFKEKGLVKKERKLQKIQFDSFNNEERIKFFWSLTGDSGSDIFDFQKIIKMDFGPDDEEVLPEDIEWMSSGQVNDLNLNGEDLHKTFFIENQDYHKFLIFAEMEAQYKFEYHGASGVCNVWFGFPKYFSSKDSKAEFILNISTLSLDPEYSHVDKKRVRLTLLNEFEKVKVENYNLFASQKVNKLFTAS